MKVFLLCYFQLLTPEVQFGQDDIQHLEPLTNVPTKYQLPTPNSFRDIEGTRIYRSRLLRQGQRSNQGYSIMSHTYNPQLMSLPSINFLHLSRPIQTPWVKTIPDSP